MYDTAGLGLPTVEITGDFGIVSGESSICEELNVDVMDLLGLL